MLRRLFTDGVVVVLFCCTPGGTPYEMSMYENCTNGMVEYIGDGYCDGINNTPDCGYDGGDCCICTCVGSMSCTSSSFNCIDPDAGDELYACDEIPSEITSPCSDDVEKIWTVEDAVQARILAETTKCSGGSFQVEWIGNISLDETIYAVDGTVLHIYGTHAGAVISGNLEKRLITVVNASLYLTNVRVEFGFAGIGGAIAASRSNLTLNQTSSVSNQARGMGGALYVMDESIVSFDGETTLFANNVADTSGGAIYVAGGSVVSWKGRNTSFIDNLSYLDGGAATIRDGSVASWSGAVSFSNNTCGGYGGAVHATNHTNVAWNGPTHFFNNTAEYGGAISNIDASNVSLNSETTFTKNTASAGGAVNILGSCTANFNSKTIFDANAANASSNGQGGALSITYSNVYFRDKAIFVGNTALKFGGAVAVMAEISASKRGSTFVLAGSTVFENNTCEENGGALGMLGGVLVQIETTEIIFSGNRADIAGGAIFMWGNYLGPYFIGVSFFSNFASHGGGVYSAGSGNALYGLSEQRSNPVVFIGCSFVDNQAVATGGAIHSAAGQDLVINTTFSGNMASEGGALNLAGTTVLVNCSFVENISDEGRGPVVANMGYMGGILNCSFHSNAFSCQRGEFLGYNLSNNVFEVLCNGCIEPCEGCYFERPSISPFCSKTMENSDSPGGLTTIELVMIDSGYWRATPSGKEVLPCYNTDACLGGLTGEPDFCLEGYEGPYCAICSDGYSPKLGFSCNRCSDSIGRIAAWITTALVLLVAVILATSYLLSTELDRETKRTCVHRLVQYIPLQSVKVVIVVWQIVIQFTFVGNVHYPHVYQRFLDGVLLLNFDLGWMLSASCVVDIDFHDRLLFATLGPIVVFVFLGLTYRIAVGKNRQSRRAVQNVRLKHLSAVLLTTLLVYAHVSSILFQTFACEHLEDGKFYLRADYRIECDSTKHEKIQVYAGLMMMLYTVGLPVFYVTLLFKNQDIMINSVARKNNDSGILPTSSLWKQYKPSAFYFEVVEFIRRVLLAGVVVFFNPNTASQIAATLTLALIFVIISESLDLYASEWDTWLSRIGHVVVITSDVALLLQVDVHSERHNSQHTFGVVLLLLNGCMIAAVVIEAFLMACALECWSGGGQEGGIESGSYPRFVLRR